MARILVVEDNEDNLALIDYLLRSYGYDPLIARNGKEGLQITLDEKPDLILLDLRMPEMDGYELCEAVRNQPGFEQIKVVAVTASAMVGDQKRIEAAGFNGYIKKPIDPETFLEKLQPFL